MPDMSLTQFIGHLAAFHVRQQVIMYEAMDRAAALVQREARREIGAYQNGGGPFVAWAELADRTKADRVAQGFTENDPGLRTGEMRESIGRQVAHNGMQAAIGSNDDKAVWFELGTSRQPPRSFLGLAAFREERRIAEIQGRAMATTLVGGGHRLLPIHESEPLP